MNRLEGRDELTRPVVEDIDNRHALGHGEGEVEIGEASPGVSASEPTTAPATMRGSVSARWSTQSRMRSRSVTLNICLSAPQLEARTSQNSCCAILVGQNRRQQINLPNMMCGVEKIA
jgi:hypothetical protein